MRWHVFPGEDGSDWSFSAGESLGVLAYHWLQQYCSETTQGHLTMFRDSVFNALGLLGLHLMPGPCWVAIPRAWWTPVLEKIQYWSFSLCLGYLFWQHDNAKPWEYRRASITLRNVDDKTPASKPNWFSFWWRVYQHSSHLWPQLRDSGARLACVQFPVLLGRSGLHPHLPFGWLQRPAIPAADPKWVAWPRKLWPV